MNEQDLNRQIQDEGVGIRMGYCHCGCGQKTNIAKLTNRKAGQFKGEPQRFILGHQRAKTLVEFFWERVTPGATDECWEWQGAVHDTGYGRIMLKKKGFYAHRVSYELHHGLLEEGLCACHTCDNRLCVNPNHLFAGTRDDNNADMRRKERHVFGEKSPQAKLTEADVIQIRSLAKSGLSQREIGERYGVHRVHVGDIIQREYWSHLP